MYLGLAPDVALDCFHYHKFGASVVENGKKTPRVLERRDGYLREELIGESDTPCFGMQRHTLNAGCFTLNIAASVWICTDGEGVILSDGERTSVSKGDYFFLPAAASGGCTVETESGVQLVSCVGGK